jgi:serine/threonine protein kinase
LEKPLELHSVRTGLAYKLARRLGKGGFGEAWEAIPRKGKRRRKSVCVKISRDSESWHRECYFGEILRGVPGAIQMSDEFVWQQGSKVIYCAVFELASGSVSDLRPPWTSAYALRQFKQIVAAAAALHHTGAVHRDITPMNVLVTLDNRLVLADFGIATHGVEQRVKADRFNPWYAPDSVFRERANWEPRDDVWQLGQLLALLLDRRIESLIAPEDVRRLECPDDAKALIYRSIAPRKHRFGDAGRLLEAWKSAGIPFSRVKRIAGQKIVFTGAGSRIRSELTKLAHRTRAVIQKNVALNTDLVVVCGDSPMWAAGSEGGKKILAALEQRDRGLPIRFINEATFVAAAARR